jgi:hypothetical protein
MTIWARTTIWARSSNGPGLTVDVYVAPRPFSAPAAAPDALTPAQITDLIRAWFKS